MAADAPVAVQPVRAPVPALHPVPVFGHLERPDGVRLRHARWDPDGPPRGTVLLLTGRSEFIEKYAELAGDWLARGYRVFGLDWRGQGLSSRLLPDRQKGHIDDYATLVADLDGFVETVVAPAGAGPRVLFAHSMGGHVALRYLLDHGDRFAAAVLSAPMLDIITDPFPRLLAELVARLACALGLGAAWAPGQKPYDPAEHRFEGNAVTHDPGRWAVHHAWYRHNPDLIVGGVTYGWLAATFRSAALLRRALARRPPTLPVLVLSAPDDRFVPAHLHPVLCRRLPNAALVQLAGAHHEILQEIEPIRARAWAAIDAFLARALAAAATTP